MKAIRFDASPIKAQRDDAGFLRGEANLTRTGVLVYRNVDGTSRRELRLPDEVFHKDSLASLALAPMTLGHPRTGEMVTSRSAKQTVIGTLGENIKQAGKFVRAAYVVHDEAAIKEIEAGRAREISLGYNCHLDATPGVHEGEPYDCIQREIRYNHAAVLPRGRAGSEVRIDSADVEEFPVTSNAPSAPQQRQQKMKTIRIDGIEYEIGTDACAQALAKQQAKIADDAKAHETAMAAAKAEADKQRARADGLEEDNKKLKAENTAEAVEKRVSARVTLVAQATKVLGKEFKCDGKSDDEIKRAVIKKAAPQAKLDGQSADYVNARFDGVIEATRTDAADESRRNLRKDVADVPSLNEDGEMLDDTEDQAAMTTRNRNQWMPKASA